MNIGDFIFEIHAYKGKLYLNKRIIGKITSKGRIMGDRMFEPFAGLKTASINNFTRQYRCWWERGNHLNMFRMYSLEKDLDRNIRFFRKKYTKITGIELPSLIVN